MADIAELGFAVDSKPVQQAAGDVAKFEQAVTKSANTLDQKTKPIKKNFNEINEAVSKTKSAALELAKGIAAGFGVAGIAATLNTSISKAREFQKAMAEVATLLDDTSGLDKQARALRDLSVQYGTDATLQAKAYYQAISAGAAAGADAIGVLDAANRLAVGGVTDVATAVDGLTSVLNAYGDRVASAADVSDTLFIGMRAGKTTIGELSASLGQVAPIAATVGVEFDELVSAVSAITTAGVSTNIAVTQVRAALAAVLKPTSEASKLAEKLGLDFSVSGIKAKGFAGFLEEVREKTGGSEAAISTLFGSVEAIGGMLALTGTQAEKFADILGQQAERAGATSDAYDKMAQTGDMAFRQLGSAINDQLITAGEELLNTLAPAARMIAENIVTITTAISSGAKIAGAYFALFVAAPAIWNATTVAVWNYVAARTAANAADAAGTKTTQGLVSQMGLLKVAANSLMALLVGWEIGSYLRENFSEARQAGIYFVESMEKGFATLNMLWDLYVAGTKFAINAVLNFFKKQVVSLAEMSADAAEALDVFGMNDERIASMRKFAASIRPVETATETLSREVAEATRKYEAKLRVIDQVTDEMLADEIATTAAAAANVALGKSADGTTPKLEDQADALTEVGDSAQKAAAEFAECEDALRELQLRFDDDAALQKMKRAFDDNINSLEQEIRILSLTGNARRDYVVQLEAERMAREANNGDMQESVERYKALLQQIEQMRAMEEAARAWQSMWTNAADGVGDAIETALFNGAEDGADALMGVMKQLARDLARFWLQQKIVIPIQQQIAGGSSGGLGQVFNLFGGGSSSTLGGTTQWGAFGPGSSAWSGVGASSANTAFGSSIFGDSAGQWFGGNTGWSAAGNALGAIGGIYGVWDAWRNGPGGGRGALSGAASGAAAGTAIMPGIGTAIGAIVGALAGFFGGRDEKPRLRINSTGAGIGNIGTRGETALGTLAFNADDLEDTRGTERQLLEAIQGIDQGFVNLVSTFGLGEDQLNALREVARNWSIDLRNSAITGDAVLGSRFSALLETFSEDVQNFVSGIEGTEASFAALGDALFIEWATESGMLADNFAETAEILQRFRIEGESLDGTFSRVIAATVLLDDAVSLMGVNLERGRLEIVEFANEIAEAAGGLDRASALWQTYFENFYSESEIAAFQVEQATAMATRELADIGLAIDQFQGSQGLADFRELFESVLPGLTAEQVVAWLEAAAALGVLSEATALLAQYAEDAADDISHALAPGGRPGGGAVFDPNAEIVPGGGVRETPRDSIGNYIDEIVRRSREYNPPVVVGGSGYDDPIRLEEDLARERERLYQREMDWLNRLLSFQDSLLLDPALTNLSAREQFNEALRQYQNAYDAAQAGDEIARGIYENISRQVLQLGRGQFGTSDAYDSLLERILSDSGALAQTARDTAEQYQNGMLEQSAQTNLLLQRQLESSETETAAVVTELRNIREEIKTSSRSSVITNTLPTRSK